MTSLLVLATLAVAPNQGNASPQARVEVVHVVASPSVVELTVAAFDQSGRRIDDLAAQDFSVVDAGNPQQVIALHRERADGKQVALNASVHKKVAILFGPLNREPRARAVADSKRLLRSLQAWPGVEVQVIDGSRVVQGPTTDLAAAERAIDLQVAPRLSGGANSEDTSLWALQATKERQAFLPQVPTKPPKADGTWLQATAEALQAMARGPALKSLVYLAESDIRNAGSLLSQLAVEHGVTLYSVFEGVSVAPESVAAANDGTDFATLRSGDQTATAASDAYSQASRDRLALDEMARTTGGQLITKGVRNIPELVAHRLAGAYVVAYRRSPVLADGRMHPIQVSVDRFATSVGAEEGYLAPAHQ